MKVTFDLDPKDVWILTDRAEKNGLTLPEMLRRIAVEEFTPSASTPDRVKALWQQGLPDADIAARIKITPGYVAGLRRDMGLAPHKRFTNRRTAA